MADQDPDHPGQPPRAPGAPPPDWASIMRGDWAPFAPAPVPVQNAMDSPQPNSQVNPQPPANQPRPAVDRPPSMPSPSPVPRPTSSQISSHSTTPTTTPTASQIPHQHSMHDIRSALAFGIMILLACIALFAVIIVTMLRRKRRLGTYFKSRTDAPDDEKSLAAHTQDDPWGEPGSRRASDDFEDTETITVAFPGRMTPSGHYPLSSVPEDGEAYEHNLLGQIESHKQLAQGIVTPDHSLPPTPSPATWLPWKSGSLRSFRSGPSQISRNSSNATKLSRGTPSSATPVSSRHSSIRGPLRSMLRRTGTY